MAVFIRLAGWAVLSQLLADDLQLFPQDVVALVLIDMFLYFSLP